MRGVEDRVQSSSGAALFEISSKSACTFPWTSMITSAWASFLRSRSFSARSLATSRATGRPAAVAAAEGGLEEALAVLASPVGDQARVEALPAQDGALLAGPVAASYSARIASL